MKQVIVFDTSAVISAGAYNRTPLLIGPLVTTSKGFKEWTMPIGGIKFLFNYIYEHKDCELVFAMDREANYKKEMYPEYKANRLHKDYDDLAMYKQRDLAELILKDIGFNVFSEEGFEADDITYSIWHDNLKSVDELNIVTNDSDYFFMVNPKTSIIPASSRGKTVDVNNFSKVANKDYYIPYNAIMVYKIIFGDMSDNINGISSKDKCSDIFNYLCKKCDPRVMFVRNCIERMIVKLPKEYRENFNTNLNLIFPCYRHLPEIEYGSVDYDKLNEWGRALGNYRFGKAGTSNRIAHLLESWIYDGKI